MWYIKKEKNKLKKILCFAVLILCLSFVFTGFNYVKASETNTNLFDNTNVLTDLQGAENFDINAYPYNSQAKHPYLINFVEYCYSYNANNMQDYALYVYIHNPQRLDIVTTSLSNKIQIALRYKEDNTPKSYEKYSLKFCNASTGNYSELFYKFRVIFNEPMFHLINSNERRYDVSGFELTIDSAVSTSKTNEYLVGGTYIFKGYSKGYGADATKETLTCTVNKLETITLDIKQTYFRTGISSAGAGHQNQVNTAYFSVPNEYFERYGNLQRIKAEWYEYKTMPIVVVGDYDLYSSLNAYMYASVPSYNSTLAYGLYADFQQDPYYYSWGYNPRYTYNEPNGFEVVPRLRYLFFTGGIPAANYVVSSGQLSNWIKTYQYGSANDEKLNIKNGNINANLFKDTVDAGRTIGHNLHDIDSDSLFNLLSYDSNHSWWDKFLDYGFWKPDNTDGNYFNQSPIHIMTSGDLVGTVEDISKKLLIDRYEVDSVITEYNNKKADNKTILFRFAQTDYYSKALDVGKSGWGALGTYGHKSGLANYRQQTVFFDFDILQLTFNKEGVYYAVAVVSNPTDIIDDSTPPIDTPPDLLDEISRIFDEIKKVLNIIKGWIDSVVAFFKQYGIYILIGFAVLVGVPLLCFLVPPVWKFVKFVLSGILKVFTAPFKLIGKLFKRE